MAALAEELLAALRDLKEEQFKLFRWYLKQSDERAGVSAIPEAELDGADRQDTVDLMVRRYAGAAALQRSIHILGKMGRNDLSGRLTALQTRLQQTQARLRLMIGERRDKIQEVQRSAELSRKSAQRQISDAGRVFGLLLQLVQKSRDDLLEELKEQQSLAETEARGLVQELNEEISELTRRSENLDQLVRDGNLRVTPELPERDWTAASVRQPSYGRPARNSAERLQEKLQQELDAFVAKARLTRAQQFEVAVTLDPDTAHPHLVVSPDGKQVYCGAERRDVPERPGRFDTAVNVLARQRFSSGRCYYQVQVEGNGSGWDVGVVRESISRRGPTTVKPENGFWTIGLRGGQYRAPSARLHLQRPLRRLGVLVDFHQSSVSFFNVDSAELVHRFTDCCFQDSLLPLLSPGRPEGGAATLVISTATHLK